MNATKRNIARMLTAIVTMAVFAVPMATAGPVTCKNTEENSGSGSGGTDTWNVNNTTKIVISAHAEWDCDGSGRSDYSDLEGAWYAEGSNYEFGGSCFADSVWGEWEFGVGGFSGDEANGQGSCKHPELDDNVTGVYAGTVEKAAENICAMLMKLRQIADHETLATRLTTEDNIATLVGALTDMEYTCA